MKPLAALSLILLAQLAHSADTAAPLATRTLHEAANLKGEDVLAVPGRPNAWLVTSANRGLMLVNENRQEQILTSGNFEALDARNQVMIGGQSSILISAIDKNSGAIALFALDDANAKLTELARFDIATALPETQCLYRDRDDGHISLFAADAQGMVHQRIIYDGRAQAMADIPVRSFVGVPDTQACAADDSTGALYLAEESLGVWRYDTDAETDASREPLALVKPHGTLAGEVADIAIADSGELWVLSAEPATLQRYSDDGLIGTYSLGKIKEAKTLALARTENGLAIALFDEDKDRYRQAELPLPRPVTATNPTAIASVQPSVETAAVARFGDAADDPVIWHNRHNPKHSLIIGTDKREGLKVYGLDGGLRQSLEVGRLNNVDLIASTTVKGRKQALIAASNRNLNSISLFTIDSKAKVHHLGEINTNLNEVYGLCMYQSASGDYVFINDSDGRYQQYRVTATNDIGGELVREFSLPSQPEGCAVDAVAKLIYMGEEKAGIWQAGAEPDGAAPQKIIVVDDYLTADVEGMDIYTNGERNFLIVSSQGNNSYVVYGLWAKYPRLAHFRIGANLATGVDGVSETDGLAVTSTPLPGYPNGLLVVQDGRNRMPEQPQNFKLVDWRQIQDLIDSPAPQQKK